MGIKIYRPTSPGRRNSMVDDYKDITKSKPEKKLTKGLKKHGGRNSSGKITVRHRGGGHKRRYRTMDFVKGVSGSSFVMSIEYDPNRTARIALLRDDSGKKRYILATNTMKVGDKIFTGESAPVVSGNSKPIGLLPLGTLVHGIELQPGKGAKLVRSAGTSAQIMAHETKNTLVRMPSREMRYVYSGCSATVGVVSNLDHKNLKFGKAGRSRHIGRRPSVRGSAMAPSAHPHGGGEGHSPIGLKAPKTPWGKPALGARTRTNKVTDNYILRRRNDK